MQKIIWLDSAVNDLVRLRTFVAAKNPKAAIKIAKVLKKAVIKLEALPNTGKPVDDLPDYRDLPISFGAAGYMLRYRIYEGSVYIVHIKHYRERRFKIN
jgi:plasmid stabilization system protein ParE